MKGTEMQPSSSNYSEIARLRDQIAREHEAACWARQGMAVGTAQHRFITRRYERIGICQERLAELMGEPNSLALVIQTLEDSFSGQRDQAFNEQNRNI